MRIHLATVKTDNTGEYNVLIDEGYPNHLFSFAYKRAGENPATFPMVWQQVPSNLIVDSGAFTVHNSSGKTITPQEYAEWALAFRDKWIHRLNNLYFMNLDVIGDEEKTMQNLKILEGLGMTKLLPIFTYRADFKHLEYMLENYDYIAFGGLFDKPNLKRWLDACFSRVVAHYKRTGVMRKVHLLGVVQDWSCERYPCFSCDSSSWQAGVFCFGNAQGFRVKTLPRYKEGAAELAANLHAVRLNIQKLQKMQEKHTNLWASRGISWED